LKFNFYNLVVLPAILGIGCDNGVHLAHRYREEGKKSMWEVLSSTGQHITIGSFTTMFGFAGLLFTSHPGLQSIGVMAVIGIGMTLLTALTFLPAMVQFLEDKHLLNKSSQEQDASTNE
jgi:predicted RND superfamily exporter protein